MSQKAAKNNDLNFGLCQSLKAAWIEKFKGQTRSDSEEKIAQYFNSKDFSGKLVSDVNQIVFNNPEIFLISFLHRNGIIDVPYINELEKVFYSETKFNSWDALFPVSVLNKLKKQFPSHMLNDLMGIFFDLIHKELESNTQIIGWRRQPRSFAFCFLGDYRFENLLHQIN